MALHKIHDLQKSSFRCRGDKKFEDAPLNVNGTVERYMLVTFKHGNYKPSGLWNNMGLIVGAVHSAIFSCIINSYM